MPDLRRLPGCRGVMLKMRNNDPVNNFELSFLILDGNKANRFNLYPAHCNANYRENGMSATLKGSGFSIHDVTIENTMCGSALELSGSNFNVYNNTIVNSGYSEGGPAGGAQPYADGITLIQCINANVSDNRVFEATDVGIVVGQSTTQNCNVSRNTVRNQSTYAFAGISNGGPTAHSGSYVSDNIVESGLNLMGFGVWVGEGPWLDPQGKMTAASDQVAAVSGMRPGLTRSSPAGRAGRGRGPALDRGLAARRRRDEAAPLVEPNRLDRDACRACELTDAHRTPPFHHDADSKPCCVV